MAEIISIPRQVLHQEVATRLRQHIVEGRIAPGAKLNERELSESLKVSRTPLREAIKMLAAEGLVELLTARDSTGMRALMVQHLENKRDAVLELMRSGQLHRRVES